MSHLLLQNRVNELEEYLGLPKTKAPTSISYVLEQKLQQKEEEDRMRAALLSEDLEMQEIKHAAEIDALEAHLEVLKQQKEETERLIQVEELKETEITNQFQKLQDEFYSLDMKMNQQAKENQQTVLEIAKSILKNNPNADELFGDNMTNEIWKQWEELCCERVKDEVLQHSYHNMKSSLRELEETASVLSLHWHQGAKEAGDWKSSFEAMVAACKVAENRTARAEEEAKMWLDQVAKAEQKRDHWKVKLEEMASARATMFQENFSPRAQILRQVQNQTQKRKK